MSKLTTPLPVRSAAIEAVVTRADGSVERLGTVSYWHRNPVKRLWFRLFGKV